MLKNINGFIAILTMVLISGCSTPKASKLDLTGQWQLKTATNKTFQISIIQNNDFSVFIDANDIELSGQYKLSESSLVLVKANQPRLHGIEFQRINEDKWVLTNSPNSARLQTVIIGSILTRLPRS